MTVRDMASRARAKWDNQVAGVSCESDTLRRDPGLELTPPVGVASRHEGKT